ncbi:hypothetical protein [Streptomyces sp. DT18]
MEQHDDPAAAEEGPACAEAADRALAREARAVLAEGGATVGRAEVLATVMGTEGPGTVR